MQGLSPQQATIQARLPFVIIFLALMAGFLLLNLANFQFYPRTVRQELERRGSASVNSIRRIPAERGLIYDRDGEPFAFNAPQYRIGVSPSLVADPAGLASELASILGADEYDVLQTLNSDELWKMVAGPVPAQQGQAIADLGKTAITIEAIPKRFYPQGTLAGHVIGFVVDEALQGVMGVEGAYNDILAGRVLDLSVSNIPLNLPEDIPTQQRGQDIILTLDRDIQFWVESELGQAIRESGASRGSIIVMDPRDGDILAMASYPEFDPNHFIEIEDPDLLRNPAINDAYEPGTLMQILTVASALERDVITPYWTYEDRGRLEIGGVVVRNRNSEAYGAVDAAEILIRSFTVGSAQVSLEMGSDNFYSMMQAFGLGQNTGIDLFAEAPGSLNIPGDSEWSESDLGINSFGQGLTVTPIQMITAFAAIANDGIMRQPRIVRQIITQDGIQEAQPITTRRVISAETAAIVTDMMIRAVNEGSPQATLPGYTIAGKAGTAKISTAVDYETGPNSSIVSFVGFLPAEDPQAVVMIKLDRPDNYRESWLAAPFFRRLADRLVILLEIPANQQSVSG